MDTPSRRVRPRTVLLAVAAVLVVMIVAAVAAKFLGGGLGPDIYATGALATPPPGDDRGTALSSTEIDTSDEDLARSSKSIRTVVYRSISGVTGQPTTVNGTIAVPNGNVPEGGWPIVSLAHGTSGILPECGPTASTALRGVAPSMAALLKLGYVVAATDYEGLGPDQATSHPYLEPTTAANNVIDIVRTARYTVPDTSTRWAAVGGSQGGQAAWAANEAAATYGTGLDMVGAVALSPAANVTDYVTAAATGKLTGQQKQVYPMLITGIHNADPAIEVGAYLHDTVEKGISTLLECVGENQPAKDLIVNAAPQTSFAPSTPADADALTAVLSRYALPRTPAAAPMLVVYGDADMTVIPSSTDGAIDKACAQGDVIEVQVQAGKGHAVDPTPFAAFLKERFSNTDPKNDCASRTG
ncbi:lipase family protein [Rhodococcoides trifolii]|uniref:lipase family protein n=1 Tax=Rhodococcoides trifolii TaxID=908250 RepID=UPI0016636D1F|nr:lipase family protein [Rhodococcus trifolii]